MLASLKIGFRATCHHLPHQVGEVYSTLALVICLVLRMLFEQTVLEGSYLQWRHASIYGDLWKMCLISVI